MVDSTVPSRKKLVDNTLPSSKKLVYVSTRFAPLQSIVARKYLATTTLGPPQWGTLWGGALDAED